MASIIMDSLSKKEPETCDETSTEELINAVKNGKAVEMITDEIKELLNDKN